MMTKMPIAKMEFQLLIIEQEGKYHLQIRGREVNISDWSDPILLESGETAALKYPEFRSLVEVAFQLIEEGQFHDD